MAKPAVEKEILQHGLEQRKDADSAQVALGRQKRPTLRDANADDNHNAGNGEARASKDEARSNVRAGNAKQFIADFDARIC